MRTYKILMALFMVPFIITACSESENFKDTSQVRFFLTDAPDNFQEVNIDVRSIEVIINDSVIELETYQGIYNILEFVNGKDTMLVTDDIPSGTLSQVRLILGDNNSVKIDDVTYDIKTPSAQESGLKFNVHHDISSGNSYSYVIDFDASKSIVKTGNGKYILKPAIRVFTEAVTGSIKGIAWPPEARPTILAIGSADDTTTVFSDTINGNFMIRGLTEGYYDLEFLPVEGFSDTMLTDIEVIAGRTTLIDTVWIQ